MTMPPETRAIFRLSVLLEERLGDEIQLVLTHGMGTLPGTLIDYPHSDYRDAPEWVIAPRQDLLRGSRPMATPPMVVRDEHVLYYQFLAPVSLDAEA